MCQDTVVNILKSDPSRWWSTKAISRKCKDTALSSINSNLKQLSKYNLIWKKEGHRNQYKIYLYKYKHHTPI